jgi:hypothetical protein
VVTPAEHAKLAIQLDEQAVYWWHQIPDGDRERCQRYATFLAARAQVHATLYHPPIEPKITGTMPPRVWPQDHATDLTVVGPVLTEEPGPDVRRATDADGDTWERFGQLWACITTHGNATPQPWATVADLWGPMRSAA